MRKLTPVGRLVRLVALALVVGGLYLGYGLHSRQIGVIAVDPAHPTLTELGTAAPIDCGTAFHQQFGSINCSNALDGHKTLAALLLIVGVASVIASGFLKTDPPEIPSVPVVPTQQ
jgi:hypothetical protein